MNNKPFLDLENRLSNMIKPVMPDPEFINSLKTKLVHTPSMILEQSKRRIGWIVIGASVFTGALAMWVINFIKKHK